MQNKQQPRFFLRICENSIMISARNTRTEEATERNEERIQTK